LIKLLVKVKIIVVQNNPRQSPFCTPSGEYLDNTFVLQIFNNKNYTTMATTELFIKMVFDRWNASLKNFDTLLDSLTDEQLEKEIVPGKNRGIYLLGHLVAVHDDMLTRLDIGDKLYPELNEPFLKSPDKAVADIPSVKELRTYWTKQCEVLKQKFDELTPSDWFQKHSAVSAEDFAKEPHRNKLNIIITRTTHLQYHIGQLVLLK
jgi:hypothetical protein